MTHHKLDALITKFLWQGKKSRISLKKLRLDKNLGGVNLADFKQYQTAFLAKQGTYWLTSSMDYTPVWLQIERSVLNDLPPATLLTSNLSKVICSKSIFKNTRAAFLKVDRHLDINIKNSHFESLWDYRKIQYKGLTLYINSWIRNGIYFPHQFFFLSKPTTIFQSNTNSI